MSEQETTQSAVDVMRGVFDETELTYEMLGDGEIIRSQFALSGVDVSVYCQGDNQSLVVVVVSFPIRVQRDSQAAVGEFLHRANYSLARQVWEMDYDDGEVRLRVHVDTCFGSALQPDVFRAILDYAILMAEAYFPFLNAVITKAMKPEFALDQAQAAYNERTSRDDED